MQRGFALDVGDHSRRGRAAALALRGIDQRFLRDRVGYAPDGVQELTEGLVSVASQSGIEMRERLYDGTVAADYYQAMGEVERHLTVQEDADRPVPSVGQLLALVDSLQAGTLNDVQWETLYTLRAGLLVVAGRAVGSSHEGASRTSDSDPAAGSD